MLGLRQLGLGGWPPAEAMAIVSEMAAWQREGGFTDRDNALRWVGGWQGCACVRGTFGVSYPRSKFTVCRLVVNGYVGLWLVTC